MDISVRRVDEFETPGGRAEFTMRGYSVVGCCALPVRFRCWGVELAIGDEVVMLTRGQASELAEGLIQVLCDG